MEAQNDGYRSAETLVDEKDVTSPSGFKYRIRRISPLELFAVHGGVQDLGELLDSAPSAGGSATEVIAKLAANSARRRQMEQALEGVVRAGLVKPELGECSIWSLGNEDVYFLFGEICQLTGYSAKAAEAVAPLSETRPASSGSTDSPPPTDGGPPSSSVQG